jgi:hypothetical protein
MVTSERYAGGMSKRRCRSCGSPIPPERRADAIFCSARCKRREDRRRERAGRTTTDTTTSTTGTPQAPHTTAAQAAHDSDTALGALGKSESAVRVEVGQERIPQFTEFLGLWHFRDRENNDERPIRLDDPWPSQRQYADATTEAPRLSVMKGRAAGITVAASAFAAYRTLFHRQAQTICVSRREEEAENLLADIALGIELLPADLRPLDLRVLTGTIEWGDEHGDFRQLVALPASPNAGRSYHPSHALLDESAALTYGEQLYQSVEPGLVPSATFHCIWTPLDPSGFFESRWLKAWDGARSTTRSVYIGADQRPGRDEQWFLDKIEELGETFCAREYSRSPEEALSAARDAVLEAEWLRQVSRHWGGLQEGAAEGHTYWTGYDVAKRQDNAALVTLDIFLPPDAKYHEADVADIEIMRRMPYLDQVERAVDIQRRFGSKLVIERTGVGDTVAELLAEQLRPKDLVAVNTTEQTKQKAKHLLESVVQRGGLHYNPNASEELDMLHRELSALQWRAHGRVSGGHLDAAMALMFALSQANTDLVAERDRRKHKVRFGKPLVLGGDFQPRQWQEDVTAALWAQHLRGGQ